MEKNAYNRGNGASHSVTVRMKNELFERLNDFCERSGQPKTVAIERAVKAYIDAYDEERKKLGEAK